MYLARADGIGGSGVTRVGQPGTSQGALIHAPTIVKQGGMWPYPRVQTQLLVLHLALVRNMSEEYVEHCAIIVSSTLSKPETECESEVLSFLTDKPRLNYSEINLLFENRSLRLRSSNVDVRLVQQKIKYTVYNISSRPNIEGRRASKCVAIILNNLVWGGSLFQYLLQVDTQMCDEGCVFFGMHGGRKASSGGLFCETWPSQADS